MALIRRASLQAGKRAQWNAGGLGGNGDDGEILNVAMVMMTMMTIARY